MTFPLGIKVSWLLCCCVVLQLWIQDLKSLPFVSTDYRAEVHENIKQLAIALTNSHSNIEANNKQPVGTASGSGPACKKHKHHDETWSIILGPMFSKESKGKDDSDISETDAQGRQVDKEFQKYLAEDLISINDNSMKMVEEQPILFFLYMYL